MAFKTYYSHFEYQVMHFSQINISAIFQSYINKIMLKKFNIIIIIYLNDFLIYTDSKIKKDVEAI